MPVSCICETCGNTFLVKPSNIKLGKGKFCSQSCHYRKNQIDVPSGMKRCAKCQLPKPLDDFSLNRGSKDKHLSYCRQCDAERNQRRREKDPESAREKDRIRMRSFRKKHPERGKISRERRKEKIKIYNKQYRQDHKEERREYNLGWRHDNPEQSRKQQRKWSELHPEESVAKTRRWQIAHPDATNDIRARRRAREASAPVIEKIDRQAIYDRDGGICHLCKRSVSRKSFTLDHLIPIGPDGPHTAQNVAIAHARCNSSRGRGRRPAQLRLF